MQITSRNCTTSTDITDIEVERINRLKIVLAEENHKGKLLAEQLGLIPSIIRKEDKGEYIQSLVESRDNDDSTIVQDVMLRHHITNLNRRTLQYQENDTVNLQDGIVDDTVNSQNDTVNELKDGLKRIYIAIQNNPDITHSQLMELFNISESTAKRSTRDLKKLGYIEREGSDKTGHWIILK